MVSGDVLLLKEKLETAFDNARYFKSGPQRYSFMINSDTEMFVYPGARSTRTHLYLDPLVGLENMTLKARLKSLNDKNLNPRVCQTFLYAIEGVKELWDGHEHMYVKKGESVSLAIVSLIQALEKFALPLLGKYDTKDKVIKLFEYYSESLGKNTYPLVIFDAKTKISILADH